MTLGTQDRYRNDFLTYQARKNTMNSNRLPTWREEMPFPHPLKVTSKGKFHVCPSVTMYIHVTCQARPFLGLSWSLRLGHFLSIPPFFCLEYLSCLSLTHNMLHIFMGTKWPFHTCTQCITIVQGHWCICHTHKFIISLCWKQPMSSLLFGNS